jgi:polysaccharide pyruvyl transferase WcaK-like protein
MSPHAPRIGLFGLLGSGNSGNEASMEVVLAYLRAEHPDAVVDAMSGGADRVRAKHRIDAVPIMWFDRYDERRVSRLAAGPLKVLGKGLDVFRTAAWVRRHDAVIVPGAGVLEATLPMRPWGFPYALFLTCASGRLFGTKVALVSVGASPIRQRTTRWLSNSSARLAHYRSYRDEQSREAIRQRGIETSRDQVYPDLVFGVPVPARAPHERPDMQTVGLGLMDYYGGNNDRQRADQLHATYLEKMKAFARWLIDNDNQIRLFGGHSEYDDSITNEILADLRRFRPGLDHGRVIAESAASFAELLSGMAEVDIVVATRYHNVICALKLGKPAIALGYSEKFTALMGSMGLSDFLQFADDVDLDRLFEQFKELTGRRVELQQEMLERTEANRRNLARQFDELSVALFPGTR